MARRLFARTIESPGGLKIETIHSFCGRLLRMFPFEANVAAGFRVLEERESELLRNDARTIALRRAAQDPAAAATLRNLAIETGGEGLDALLRQAQGFRTAINEAIEYWGGLRAYDQALRARLGLAPNEDAEAVETSCCTALGTRPRN